MTHSLKFPSIESVHQYAEKHSGGDKDFKDKREEEKAYTNICELCSLHTSLVGLKQACIDAANVPNIARMKEHAFRNIVTHIVIPVVEESRSE